MFPRRGFARIPIPDDILDELRTIAEKKGDSLNRLIEEILREWLIAQRDRNQRDPRSFRRDDW